MPAPGLRVAADAFEDGRAVVDDVGHDVDLGLLPGDNSPLCQMFLVGWMGMLCSVSQRDVGYYSENGLDYAEWRREALQPACSHKSG